MEFHASNEWQCSSAIRKPIDDGLHRFHVGVLELEIRQIGEMRDFVLVGAALDRDVTCPFRVVHRLS